jgi:hypothetical protein
MRSKVATLLAVKPACAPSSSAGSHSYGGRVAAAPHSEPPTRLSGFTADPARTATVTRSSGAPTPAIFHADVQGL